MPYVAPAPARLPHPTQPSPEAYFIELTGQGHEAQHLAAMALAIRREFSHDTDGLGGSGDLAAQIAKFVHPIMAYFMSTEAAASIEDEEEPPRTAPPPKRTYTIRARLHHVGRGKPRTYPIDEA